MWFKNLMGFEEINPENVRGNIIIQNDRMISKVNGQAYQHGLLELPTLAELRKRTRSLFTLTHRRIKVSQLVDDVQELHLDESNEGALFQAASQFNLLEMASPNLLPEDGVDIYENDFTQGPACAISAGAGTIYRNYFVKLDGTIGQSRYHQINCLSGIGKELKNRELKLWNMQNGYAFASSEGLTHINKVLASSTDKECDSLMSQLKVGIQWDTQVTLQGSNHLVSQVYCSGLPIGYSQHTQNLWENFAQLILNGTYEATFHAGLLNYTKTGNPKVYLTLVGGGVFGNRISWIIDAMERSLKLFSTTPLEIIIVSFGSENQMVNELIQSFNGKRD